MAPAPSLPRDADGFDDEQRRPGLSSLPFAAAQHYGLV
ncbi:hypothetical protein [Azospirillum melinis]